MMKTFSIIFLFFFVTTFECFCEHEKAANSAKKTISRHLGRFQFGEIKSFAWQMASIIQKFTYFGLVHEILKEIVFFSKQKMPKLKQELLKNSVFCASFIFHRLHPSTII